MLECPLHLCDLSTIENENYRLGATLKLTSIKLIEGRKSVGHDYWKKCETVKRLKDSLGTIDRTCRDGGIL